MTISSEDRVDGPYVGTGSVSSYPFYFKVFTTADVQVFRTNTSGVQTELTSGFSVTLNADQEDNPGGTVTLSSPLALGFLLTISSKVANTQTTELTNAGGFLPQVITNALDKLTILVQQISTRTDRTIKIPISDDATTVGLDLPTKTLRANKALVFDANGNVAISIDNYVDQASSAASSASAAASSATSAQSFWNNFRGTYYGPLSADPSLDPLGNAISTGDIYFNTVSQVMRVWTGAVWTDTGAAIPLSYGSQSFSGNGSTTAFTLSAAPGSLAALEVFIGGVRQVPTTNYSVSGTTLTFVVAPPSGTNNVFARWTTPVQVGVPNDGSVTTAKLQDGATTTVKIANDAVTLAKLQNATNNSRVLGSGVSGAGSDYTELTLGAGLNITGTQLGVTTQMRAPWIFSTPGAFTFTTPADITTASRFKITVTGGGGSGANYGGGTGSGGAAGGTAIKWLTGLLPSTGYSGTIGAGGASTSTNNTSGNAGGASSITINGTTYTGNGGAAGTNTDVGAAGGTAVNGDINIGGGGTVGGSSGTISSAGGNSFWGGGGAAGGPTGTGTAGIAPGAGGGVSGGNLAPSGAGANGIVVIELVG